MITCKLNSKQTDIFKQKSYEQHITTLKFLNSLTLPKNLKAPYNSKRVVRKQKQNNKTQRRISEF